MNAAKLAMMTFVASLVVQSLLPAFASEVTLEEVTVTARKREESLLEVPLSISAVTAEDLGDYNFRDFTDLQYATPGFVYTESGGLRQDRKDFNYVIRGINVGSAAQAQAAAQLFIDGAPVAFGRLAGFNDVERVEVLKGPQAAYFGRNTFSGAVNVVTRTPGTTWAGRVSADVGRFQSSDVQLSLEGPLLAERLSGRVSAQQQVQGDQYVERSKGTPIGGRKTRSVGLTLHATPTDRLRMKLYGTYSEFDDGISAVFDYPAAEFGNCTPGAPTIPWICGEVPDLSVAINRVGNPVLFDQRFIDTIVTPYTFYSEPLVDHGGLGQRNLGTHLIVDYDHSSGVSLGVIAAYHSSKNQVFHESTHDAKFGFYPCPLAQGCGRPFGQYAFLIEGKGNDLSLEARLSSPQDNRIRWTLGVNYVDGETFGASSGEIPNTPPRFFSNSGDLGVQTSSVFGGIYLGLDSGWTLSAEGRYQEDQVTLIPFDPAIGQYVGERKLEGTFSSFGPRVTIDYKFSNGSMLFANWARGFRPGTFNAQLLTLPPQVVAFLLSQAARINVEEETLDQFEVGLKGEWYSGRIQGSLVAYSGKLENQQIPQSFFINQPGFVNTVSFTSNAGQTDIRGIELEWKGLLTDKLLLNGHFAWNDTEIKSDACAACVRLGATLTSSIGKRLDSVPEYTGSLAATYTTPFRGGYDWRLRGEYFYQGKEYAERLNLATGGEMHKVNVRAGLESDSVSIEAYLTNAFDDNTPNSVWLGTDLPTGLPSPKVGFPDRRQWGLRAAYSF